MDTTMSMGNSFIPNKIILYDTSALINVGAKAGGVQNSKFWQSNGIPTGGLFRFMTALLKDLKNEDLSTTAIIACKDSSTSLRKNIYSNYKSNRDVLKSSGLEPKCGIKDLDLDTWRSLPSGNRESIALKMSTILQTNLVDDILNDIGVTVLQGDGIEADDIIYSVVAAYPNTKIIIKADDHDLADCKLLNKNVVFSGCTTKSTINNVPVGELIRKVSHGCNSDCIPSISHIPETQIVLQAMSEGLLNPYEIKVGYNLSVQPLLNLNIPQGVAEIIARNIYLVYPFLCQVNLKPQNIDIQKLYFWFSVFGFQKFSKNIFGKEIDKSTVAVSQKINEYKSLVPSYLSEYLYQGNSKVSFSK